MTAARRGRHPRLRRGLLWAVAVLAVTLGVAYALLWWGVLRMAEPQSWPPTTG